MLKQIIEKSKKCSAVIALMLIMSSILAIPVFAADTAWPTTTNTVTNSTNTSDNLSATDSTSGSLSPTDNPVTTPSTLPNNDVLAGVDNVDAKNVYNSYVDVMPVVSTNDILKWATTKGNEIIYFLQIIVQPFTIIIFIIAAFITLIGSIGRGDMVGKGLWGMVMSVVVYAAVLYAPVILQTFVGWVAS